MQTSLPQQSPANSIATIFPTFPNVEFRPHRLLRSGHLQTCMAAWWSGNLATYAARQIVVPTTQGDQLVVHDDQPSSWREGDRVAVLIHGLGGCHQSFYMVRIAAKLNAGGVRTFRMDMRGCGAGDRLAQYPGHAGRSEDVAAVLQRVREACPTSKRIAVGFSLGANLLLKWLGESGAEAADYVSRALSVSAPIDLAQCAQNIQRPGRLIYNRWFVKSLLRKVSTLREHMAPLATVDLRRPPRTLYEFDDRVTAPLSGFTGADEYYRQCSAAQFLSRIRVPTLLLSAADDPLIPPAIYSSVNLSPSATVRLIPRGGHVGFFSDGRGDPDWHWLDWRVVEFVGLESE